MVEISVMSSDTPPSSIFLQCGRQRLDLRIPQVMGVINVTPDSFSDGGELHDGKGVAVDKALARAETMCQAGATIIDVGGESTRPGAAPVSAQDEIDRVLPVVEAISANLDVVISMDTSNPELMRLGADTGAGIINDVRSLAREEAMAAAAATGLPICLMHMQGEPGTMQEAPHYNDVVADVADFLQERIEACETAGIERNRLLLDPGFGFGKNLEHNLALLARLETLNSFGLPLLIGMSRKRMIGSLTGKDAKERMAGSLAAHVIAAMKGGWIIRAHDVVETVDALKVCRAVLDVQKQKEEER